MKTLLFIGHEYHQKTKSSVFILDLLKKEYNITELYIDPYSDLGYQHPDEMEGVRFDALVIWQVMPKITELQQHCSWQHGVFFPMLDNFESQGELYDNIWSEYTNFMIISFSKVMHEKLLKSGFCSKYIQYFPKPQPVDIWGNEEAVFFWQRLTSLNLCTLARAMKNLKFSSIHHHQALDPCQTITPLSSANQEEQQFLQDKTITISEWFDTKDQLNKVIENHALFMAPRHSEGIGMSFLEAMAQGRCVIAPDRATMNEYITDGETGLLYPWDEYDDAHCLTPVCIPTLTIRQIQKNAYNYITKGYAQWETEKQNIVRWLTEQPQTDASKLAVCSFLHGWTDWPIAQQPWPDAALLEKQVTTKLPSDSKDVLRHVDVSVVTVVFNAIKDHREEMLSQCLASVQMQQGISIEHIIIDGESNDGTLELVKTFDNKRHPLRILSMKDNGIYDAMNRGIALSKGDYVVFLNSDDFYHNSEGLHISVNKLRETGCAFSFAPIRAIDPPPNYCLHIYPYLFIKGVFCQAVFSHQSILTSRQVMLQMHGFDLSYKSAADYDFVLRMILAGQKGCYVDCQFVSYRMTGLSSTNRYCSTYETALIYKRLYNQHFHSQLTVKDGYRLFMEKRFSSHERRLKRQLNAIRKKAFVGLPQFSSWQFRCYLPEMAAAVKYIFTGRFTSLFHFLVIHFNSRFNRLWYYINYDEVRESGIAPAAHYLEQGWTKGFDASPSFSTKHYLQKNPDVKGINICPLVHWKLVGKKEKRSL